MEYKKNKITLKTLYIVFVVVLFYFSFSYAYSHPVTTVTPKRQFPKETSPVSLPPNSTSNIATTVPSSKNIKKFIPSQYKPYSKTIKKGNEEIILLRRKAKLYKEEVQKFKSARERLLEIRKNKNIPKEQRIQRFRNFLENAIKAIIKRLEALKLHVINHPHIPQQIKDNLIKEIERDIQALNSKLEEIKTADIEQLRNMARTLKEEWKKVRIKSRRIAELIIIENLTGASKRIENVITRVERIVNKLQERGEINEEILSLLKDAKEKYALAKRKIAEIKIKYEQARQDTPVPFKELRSAIAEIRNIIIELRKELKEIFRQLKEEIQRLRTQSETSLQEQKEESQATTTEEATTTIP